MLLIAQPKSASTSLMRTLAKILKINFQNGLGKKLGWEYCKGYEQIQKYHDTTIKRDFNFFKKWMSIRAIILKEHILPTENHFKIIKKVNCKILIVLRKPEDSLDNYRRMYTKYLDGKMKQKEIDELMPYRFNDIHLNKYLKDLEKFNEEWRAFKYNKKLIITYKDLILNYQKTMKRILSFFNYPVPKKVIPLIKAKGNHGYNTYTGIGEKRLKGELK